ncbi:MAG TPA: cupin domain-containing protein [Burkholderiaceae bacterium]|jgi:hypothetical protein
MSHQTPTDTPATAAESTPAGRIEIFFAAGSQTLQEAGMMHSEGPPPERAPLNALFAEGVAAGSSSRVLFRGPTPSSFSLVYAWFKSDYPLPAHSHSTPCLYYVIAGELAMGTKVLKAGDGFFVPAHAFYSYKAGPQGVEILEFRDACEFDFVFRGGSFPMWERAGEIMKNNLERWKTEAPPPRSAERAI